VNVESALCIGVRRRGFRISENGGVLYWRFTCDVVGVNDHYYTVQTSSTASTNSDGWYWHILAVRLEY
jgi:hypothetical protein